MEITAKVLAEALREAMNPTVNERLALQERPTPEVEPERVNYARAQSMFAVEQRRRVREFCRQFQSGILYDARNGGS